MSDVESRPNGLARVEPSVLDIISVVSQNPEIRPEVMRELFDLKERVDASNAKSAYAAAMAQMQPKLPRIKRNGTIDMGQKGQIPFARWEDIDRAIRPILSEHGFSLSFRTRIEGERTIMTCVVSHVMGHSEDSEAVVEADPGPGRNARQAFGSGRSYAKRYLANDMLNIVTEGEDNEGATTQPEFVTQEQADSIRDLLSELGYTPDSPMYRKFLAFAQSPRGIEFIRSADYSRLMEKLQEKRR